MTRDDILALEAGRETDVLVAERLGLECLHSEGFRHVETHHEYGPLYECKRGCGYQQAAGPGVNAIMTFGPRKYSSDISCAWEVVEKSGLLQRWVLYETAALRVGTVWMLQDHSEREVLVAPTAPLAICRGALLLTTLEGE